MSCRVLKRDMELAMLDELVKIAKTRGITQLNGFYYKTAKNSMVAELYGSFGFKLDKKDENGDSVWHLNIEKYEYKNKVINIKEKEKKYEYQRHHSKT